MITTVIERDDLSSGVAISTIKCEEDGRVWFETLAFIINPYWSDNAPWHATTEEEARQNHATLCSINTEA